MAQIGCIGGVAGESEGEDGGKSQDEHGARMSARVGMAHIVRSVGKPYSKGHPYRKGSIHFT
ncbi:MAG TPA: hypothetical protein DCL75_12375 [Ktedonobacter sp.]|nr:hypothetical protein [Ktedonobacter sp.]